MLESAAARPTRLLMAVAGARERGTLRPFVNFTAPLKDAPRVSLAIFHLSGKSYRPTNPETLQAQLPEGETADESPSEGGEHSDQAGQRMAGDRGRADRRRLAVSRLYRDSRGDSGGVQACGLELDRHPFLGRLRIRLRAEGRDRQLRERARFRFRRGIHHREAGAELRLERR